MADEASLNEGCAATGLLLNDKKELLCRHQKEEPKMPRPFLHGIHVVCCHFFENCVSSKATTMSEDSGVSRGEDLAQALERYIQDVGQSGFELQTPPEWDLLLSASRQNQHERVRGMIEVGGIPASHSNSIGQSSLHIYAMWGSIDCMKVLIEHGADVNAANMLNGDTPLHMAVWSHKTSADDKQAIVDILLDAGADPNLRDYGGKAPADLLVSDKLPPFPPNLLSALKEKLKARPRNAKDELMRDLISNMDSCQIIQPRLCKRPRSSAE